jgi:hypothetical protein
MWTLAASRIQSGGFTVDLDLIEAEAALANRSEDAEFERSWKSYSTLCEE